MNTQISNGVITSISIGQTPAQYAQSGSVIHPFVPPSVTIPQAKQVGNGSPNNRPNGGRNARRAGERIPDIYGKVLSYPDVISLPYVTGNNGIRYEMSYYCIGRGEYDLGTIYNGGVPLDEFSNYIKYDVYGPNTSPLSNQGTVGYPFAAVITEDVLLGEFLLLIAPNHPDAADDLVQGPYFFHGVDNITALFNTVASSSTTSFTSTVSFRMTFREIDANDQPFGPSHIENIMVTRIVNSLNFTSYTSNQPFGQNFQVTLQRTNNENNNFALPAVSRLYGVADLNGLQHFGDVTTLRIARSLFYFEDTPNLETISVQATRKINGVGTSSFAKIAEAVCLDPAIGNRSATEVDSAGLNATKTAVDSLFGTTKVSEFNYTFDDGDISFEETLNTITRAAFSTVYREGPVLKFALEGETPIAKMVFNHRNKVPRSEQRALSFSRLGEQDGVRFEYSNVTTATLLDLVLPPNAAPINPNIDAPVGITNRLQMYFHAHRENNRQQYRNSSVEFVALAEAALLKKGDYIVVADNTRTQTADGEVTKKEGLVLTLSQPYEFESGVQSTIFVQTVSGVVESIDISPIAGDKHKVLLSVDLQNEISTSPDSYCRATYEILKDGDERRGLYQVESVEPQGNGLFNLQAVNFDSRYFANDADFINEVVDANGELL